MLKVPQITKIIQPLNFLPILTPKKLYYLISTNIKIYVNIFCDGGGKGVTLGVIKKMPPHIYLYTHLKCALETPRNPKQQ